MQEYLHWSACFTLASLQCILHTTSWDYFKYKLDPASPLLNTFIFTMNFKLYAGACKVLDDGPASCSNLIPQFSSYSSCFHSSGFFPLPQTSHFLFYPRPFALAFDLLGIALFLAFCMDHEFLFLLKYPFPESPFLNPYLKHPLPISLNSLCSSL